MRLILVSCALLAACGTPSDLGQPCTLVRAGPDGGAEPIPKSDPAIAFQAGADIVSLAVPECHSRVCVRDAQFHGDVESNPNAQGYCSTSCGPCDPGFECRALVLDQQTLDRLRRDDPERYGRIFGETRSPYFCARPATR